MNCFNAFLTLAALALVEIQCYELYVLNSPESIKFNQSKPLHANQLADTISGIYGFTSSDGLSTWRNLMVSDPFSLPEAVVVFEIPGLKDPKFNLNEIDFHHLIADESLENVYATVEHRIKQRLNNKEYSLVHGSLTNEEFLKNDIFHPSFKLNPSNTPQNVDLNNEKYKVFINEIYHLHQLGQGIKEKSLKNNVPDFHWFQLQGVKALNAVDDQNTKEEINSEEVLNDAISSLVQSYKETYDNQVFIIAITDDGKKSLRSKRKADDVESKLNVAEPVSNDFPVIFNLLLWFTIVFIFSLLAISLSISQMDPGRDSIIYRMTSNRMKKEN